MVEPTPRLMFLASPTKKFGGNPGALVVTQNDLGSLGVILARRADIGRHRLVEQVVHPKYLGHRGPVLSHDERIDAGIQHRLVPDDSGGQGRAARLAALVPDLADLAMLFYLLVDAGKNFGLEAVGNELRDADPLGADL